MAEPVKPLAQVTTTHPTIAASGKVETVEEMHPALTAYSATDVAAVTATHTKGGTAVHGISSGDAGLFQGNVQITGNLNVGGDIFLPGADVAEQFDVAGGVVLVPGTLVAMGGDGALRPCVEAYDKTVVGVVAGAGRYRPGVILDSAGSEAGRARVSLVGRAFCYVDAGYGAVAMGDLLTSSETPGYAMKAGDPARAFGAVVGKALMPLAEGAGMIPILVTLQ